MISGLIDANHNNIIVSHNDMINILFSIVDIDKNRLLSYEELYRYQMLTDPHIELTYSIYKQIYKKLSSWNSGCYHNGLDIDMFNKSYTIYSEELGTNLIKDFIIIMRHKSIM